MKKLVALTLSAVVLTACGDEKPAEPTDPNAPTQDEMASFTSSLSRIPVRPTSCFTEKLGERYYTGCRPAGGNGNTYLFLYNREHNKRFYALNGTAMSAYEKYLTQENIIGDYKETFGLPLAPDIQMGEVMDLFKQKEF